MKRAVIVGRVVSIEPVFHHLIDEPAVDALIEVRWLDPNRKKRRNAAECEDQPRHPVCSREPELALIHVMADSWRCGSRFC